MQRRAERQPCSTSFDRLRLMPASLSASSKLRIDTRLLLLLLLLLLVIRISALRYDDGLVN